MRVRQIFGLVFLFALAIAAGAYLRFHRSFPTPPGGHISGAWGVEKSGSGLAVNWNFEAPLFRNAGNVTLEIQDGGEQRKIALSRSERAGTLFYTPHDPAVTLRLVIDSATPGEPRKTEVIRLGAQNEQIAKAPVEQVAAEPPVKAQEAALPEETRARTESPPVSVWRVRAFAPPSLSKKLPTGGIEIPVYVKIAPSGKVTASSTRKYDEALEFELANIATRAAMQWKFRPMKKRDGNQIYRDFVIHFRFPKG